jgi:DNA-binding NarL/FixJ family response regulator
VTAPAAPIRILIVDDHASFRSGLRALLATAPDLAVVGEASSGGEAIAAASTLQPDVILMDVTMPDGDGIEATRRILDASPHVAIVILTMDGGDEPVLAALRAGARGYVLKGAQRIELFRAIRAVASGEALFGPDIARRLSSYLGPADAPPPPFPGLTDREREILDLIAAGGSNAEITSRLVVSPKTVRNHVSNIFSKLGVRDRAEAIVIAREAGMGGAGSRGG